MMPGTRLLEFARRWFSPAIASNVFEPLVADWQREWHDNPASRRPWVMARGLAAFFCAAIVSSPHLFSTPSPSTVTNRMVTRIAGVTFIGSMILVLPFALGASEVNPSRWVLGLFIIPSAMAMAFPFAMVAAVDAIRRHEPLPAHVQRAAVTKLALVAVVFMIFFTGWIVPASNQVWRVVTSSKAGGPPPGIRELSIVELIGDPARAAVPNRYTRAGEIRRELSTRALMTALPVLLLWVRWPAARRTHRRWYSPQSATVATGVAVAGFFTLYYLSLNFEHALSWQPGTGLWLPVVIFGLVGLLQQSRSRRHEARA